MNLTLLPVDFKIQGFDTLLTDLHALVSTADLPVSSLYRSQKDGEIIGIVIENKHINRLEINSECVIITYNHWFSVF